MNPSLLTRGRPLRMLTRQLGLALLVLVAASGCKDKAKPFYDECVQAEIKWEMVKARDACRQAVEADPESDSGKAAQTKLPNLEKEAAKILEEEAKLSGPCKAKTWVTRCKYKGKPRPTMIEAESRAGCDQEAYEGTVVGMTCPVCVCKDHWVEPYENEEQ